MADKTSHPDPRRAFAVMMDAAKRVQAELARTRNDQGRKDAIRFAVQELRDARREAWEIYVGEAARVR